LSDTRSSKHYRDRAEHFRKMAETETNDRLREQLLKMAADYAGVAERMEKQGR
jgi:hypothetical protein